MEYLKGGFGSAMALFGDDSWEVNRGANAVMGDDLFVDELLDFSNGFSETEESEEMEPEKKITTTCSVSVSHEKEVTVSDNSSLTGKNDFGSLTESELTLPAEDLENLEWLSRFVDDSFSDYSLTGKVPPKPTVQVPCFTTPVQTKARTKRARTGVRVWPVLTSSFAESSSTTSSGSSISSTTLFTHFNGYPAAKKRKTAEGGGGSAASQPRRCSHCGVTKTPQWRAGPLGSKTLCNACGVRFKSGRLLPEYRPACSPTFSSDLHSNNHRKVLEMRRNKEVEVFEELLI